MLTPKSWLLNFLSSVYMFHLSIELASCALSIIGEVYIVVFVQDKSELPLMTSKICIQCDFICLQWGLEEFVVYIVAFLQ